MIGIPSKERRKDMSVTVAHESGEAAPAPREWKLPDIAEQEYEFTGWLLGKDSTETADSDRWTEIYVFRTVGGQFVLRVIGRSAVYHRHGSGCNTGDAKPGREMDADLEPCPRCRPASYLRADMQDQLFDVEVDIPTIRPCETADALIYEMHRANGRGGRQLSYLAGRLLRQIRKADADIDRALRKPRAIA
jgi:hypothetical protein